MQFNKYTHTHTHAHTHTRGGEETRGQRQDGSGNGNEDGIEEGGGEAKKRKKPHKTRVVDAIKHFNSAHVVISAERYL